MIREELALTPQVGAYQPREPLVEKAQAEVAFSVAEVLNEKANKKYEMDFQNDAADGINQAYSRNQNNPEQLNKELDGIRSGLIQNVPFNMHDDFNNQFKRAAQPYVNKATDGYDRLLTDQVKESSLRNIDLAKTDLGAYAADMLSDNPVKVIDATAAGQEKLMEAFNTISQTDATGQPVFSAAERFAMSKELIDETAFTSVRQGFDDARDKKAFLKKFEDGELKASIFLDKDQNFVSSSIKERMDRKVYEKTVNYMESEINEIEAKAEKAAEQQANLQLVDGVMNGEAILDPTNNKHQKAVDQYYKQLTPKLSEMPLTEKNNMLVDFVSKVGVWPDSMKSGVIAQLSNGSPGQKAVAADLVNAVAETNPQTMYQIPDSVRARAIAISNNINAGMDPETASKYAENSVFKIDTPEYQVRLKRFTDTKNGERIPFDYSEFGDDVPDGMVADYNTNNMAAFMDAGLDAKSAAQFAREKTVNLWHKTEADGSGRWMKYAPEAMYKNQEGTKWIGEQLRAELGAIPSMKAAGEEEDILLMPHPKTLRTPNPTYLVFKRGEYGAPEPYLNQKGNQVTFKPDYATSPLINKLTKEFEGDKAAAMIAAKNMRRRESEKKDKAAQQKGFKKARSDALMNSLENFFED